MTRLTASAIQTLNPVLSAFEFVAGCFAHVGVFPECSCSATQLAVRRVWNALGGLFDNTHRGNEGFMKTNTESKFILDIDPLYLVVKLFIGE